MREKILKEVYPNLSKNIINAIEDAYLLDKNLFNDITEIRIRKNKNVILKLCTGEIILNYVTRGQDVDYILDKISNYSIYSIQNELNQGYITILGGHRIGVGGTCILNENEVINVKNIYCINIRIARQVIGVSNDIFERLYKTNYDNTLIVSLPGFGKTTLMRDLVRNLSNAGQTVTVIDERSEIACMYNGIPQMDIRAKNGCN